MHRSRSLIAEELSACIRCNECLAACPALAEPLTIEALNNETLDGPLSPAVARYARGCYLCGACVPVCPVGLHRDAMMLWLKTRLLRGDTAPKSVPRLVPHPTPAPRPARRDERRAERGDDPARSRGRSWPLAHLAAVPRRDEARSAPAPTRPSTASQRHASSKEGA